MKKILIVLSCIVFAMAFTGCDENTSTSGKVETSKTTEQTTQETTTEATTTEETVAEVVSPDFRNINWGMTKEEVKKSENMVVGLEDDNLLAYDDVDLAGYNSILIYYFENDYLYSAVYSLKDTHSNNNKYIDDYNSLKDKYINKYGEPSGEKEIWDNDLYKDNPDRYGMAISKGDLSYSTLWIADNTQILIGLSGDNYKIQHVIGYSEKDYEPAENTNGI